VYVVSVHIYIYILTKTHRHTYTSAGNQLKARCATSQNTHTHTHTFILTENIHICRKSAEGKVCYISVQLSATGPIYSKNIPVKKGQILTLAWTHTPELHALIHVHVVGVCVLCTPWKGAKHWPRYTLDYTRVHMRKYMGWVYINVHVCINARTYASIHMILEGI
jgi:hypothetical protein